MKYLLAILMSFCVATTTSAAWLRKPVLCGPTPQIVQDFNQDNYIPIARSVIRDNEDGKILGTLLFLIKDTELFIIENFFVTNISCIISLTTDFTLIKSKGVFMQLTKNFSLAELTKSETALRHGLDNTPGEEEIENLRVLAEMVLQPIRDAYGVPVKVNSGYRHPEVNAAVGGSKTSDHCRGQAADIEIPGVPNADLAEWIKDNLEFRQLILEFYTPGIPDSGWVHVSYVEGDNQKKVMTAMKENGKTVYKPGIIA